MGVNTPRTHIKNPKNKRVSICGRKVVKFVEKNPEATCVTCQNLILDGTLEKLEFEAAAVGTTRRGESTPRFTEMQRKFANSPIVTTNCVQAAEDAGYSKSYAKNHAFALREQMGPLIMQLQEQAKKLSAISTSRVQSELAAMGFANIVDYFNIDEDSGAITPKQFNELTRDQAAAIQEVKMIDITNEETGEVKYVIGSIKLADKRANLVELGKTLGMFNKIVIEDKRESKLLMQDIPTTALQEAETLLLSAAAGAKEERRNREAIEGDFKALPPASEATDGS